MYRQDCHFKAQPYVTTDSRQHTVMEMQKKTDVCTEKKSTNSIFTQKNVFSFCVLVKKKNEQPGDGKQIGEFYIYLQSPVVPFLSPFYGYRVCKGLISQCYDERLGVAHELG